MNETDKQELSEQTLTKWLLEAGRSGADCGRVVTLVRELRTTRKELDNYLAEEITYGNPRLLDKRTAELKQDLAGKVKHLMKQSVRIAELEKALEGVMRIAARRTYEFDVARAALAKKEEKDA